MTRFTGLVGYVTQEERVPGVWSPVETHAIVRGEFIKQSSSSQNGDKVNSDISLNHRVSVLGDSYAFNNYFNLKWIKINGRKWEISSVELNRPRLTISLGGLWNG